MISNYLKIAWRNLLKSKGFSFINITGLAAGLACFILIALYVVEELSYDRYHEKADRIYRIHSHIRFGGNDLNLAVSADPMGATLKKDYPQVEEYTRLYASQGSKLITKGDQKINEDAVVHADSTFFNVFTFTPIAGDLRGALNDPNTVVITETAARKYFGTTDGVVGKTIETNDNNSTLYNVTAVIKDMPRASHFHYDFIFSMDNVDYNFGNYLSHNFHTYIVLKSGTDYRAFEKNFGQVIQKYILPQAKQFMEIKSMDEFEKAGNRLNYALMPLVDIHLKSTLFPELGVNGNIQYVYIFSAIALFVLLIACVNFMNLSTARSANRAKEVGIRKVLGTERGNLIRQFLAESTLMAFLSIILALGLAFLVLPLFNDILGKSLSYSFLFSWKVLPFLVLLPVIVGLLAGSYPAFFLSNFKPITVLKGKLAKGAKGGMLRSGLVVFQFWISIMLIIGIMVMYQQMNFIQTTKLGFNKDQVLIVDGTYGLNNPDAFKNEIMGLKGVINSTYASYLPVDGSSRNDNSFSKSAVMTTESAVSMQNWTIDYDYIPTMGMEIVKGRNFSREFGSDSTAIIINEKTAQILDFKDPIGQKIYTNAPGQNTQTVLTVIGVVKNFNFESLRKNIGPLSFSLGRARGSTAFKVSTTDIQTLVKQVEAKWKAMAPGLAFRYRFLDEAFDNMYRDEQQVGRLALGFGIIAIVIACLGLFGLATFMAEQRTKEIGIRKVLGASVPRVVGLLSADFLKLVLIAFIIAVPVSWYFMNLWLKDFAYRIDIGWWVFALAGALALVIAMLTVSFQAIRAALMNPVTSLRTE
jgi:putative ABC transport system permease protein